MYGVFFGSETSLLGKLSVTEGLSYKISTRWYKMESLQRINNSYIHSSRTYYRRM